MTVFKLLSEIMVQSFLLLFNTCVDISQIIDPPATGHLDGFHFGSILSRAAVTFLHIILSRHVDWNTLV